jgi:DNA helicase-2/ATP-dependent DNA helicase PcrA
MCSVRRFRPLLLLVALLAAQAQAATPTVLFQHGEVLLSADEVDVRQGLVQLELSRLQIPYQITSGVRFFEQAHIRDLVALLRFVYNPSDTAAWNRIAVLLPKVGDKNAARLHAAALEHAKLMQQDFIDALATDDVASKVPKDAKEEWPKFVSSLQQVKEMMRTMKPHNAVEIAIDGWYGDYLKGAFANYVSRLDDLKSMIGFASRYEDMQELLAQIMLLNSETSDRSADPEADALRLTTVHQAKGLEYSAVFLISLADGMFPLRRAIEANDVEEERRLFYVAVTRARDELYLCFPKVNTKGGPAMLLCASASKAASVTLPWPNGTMHCNGRNN